MIRIKREIIDLVPVGLYLVTFDLIWSTRCYPGEHDDCLMHGCMDREPDYVSEIVPEIKQITADNYLTLSVNVINKDISMNAIDFIGGDTHDVRPRLFEKLEQAESHINHTINRFTNPQPWEVFIKTA